MKQAFKNLAVSLLLFVVSVLLAKYLMLLIFGFGLFFALIKFKGVELLNYLAKIFSGVALGIDYLANVVGGDFWNVILTKNGLSYYRFGKFDETISYALGRNKQLNQLSRPGRFLERALHLIDKNHVEKAIIHHENKRR